MLLETAREFTSGALLCPHAGARERTTVFVRDPQGSGPGMGLCPLCLSTFGRWSAERPSAQEVTNTMLALGYTVEDAEQVWRDLEEGA